MFFVDIDKRNVMASTHEAAADDSSDGAGADGDYAHMGVTLPVICSGRGQDIPTVVARQRAGCGAYVGHGAPLPT
jgi:hypothetical protein